MVYIVYDCRAHDALLYIINCCMIQIHWLETSESQKIPRKTTHQPLKKTTSEEESEDARTKRIAKTYKAEKAFLVNKLDF